MFFCNIVSGWEDAEWKQNFGIGRPTASLCFFRSLSFAALRECSFVPGPLEFLRDLLVRHLISHHST